MNLKKLGVFILIVVLIAMMAVCMISCSGISLSTKHTIIFNVNYGDEWSVYTSIRSAGNEIIKFPSDPTKEGYVFAGWYSDQLYVKEVHEYEFEETEVTDDVNFYAKFVAASTITNPYTVTFETNKGSAVEAQEVNFGEKIDAKKATTTRAGFTFVGWYTDEALKNQFRPEYDRIWKSKTIYAAWYSTGYILTYVLDGGTNSTKNPSIYKFEETGLELQDATKLGYNFEGWYLDSAFEEEFDKTKLYDDNLTIYAKWSDPIEYTLDCDLDGATIKGGATIPTTYTVEDTPFNLPEVEKDGYDFLGWFKDRDNGELLKTDTKYAENLSIAPYLKEKTFAITYELNGGVNNSGNVAYARYFSRQVTLLDATKKGYGFLGWYLESSFNTQVISPVEVNAPITFYAKWSDPIQYNINVVDLDGGTISGSMPTEYNITQNPLTLPNATKDGYVFAGWYLDSSYTEAFNSVNEYAEELNLYAKFVNSELLLPENYIAMSSSEVVYAPYNAMYEYDPIQAAFYSGTYKPTTKNLCFPIENAVTKVKYNGVELNYATNEYVTDSEHTKLIIKAEQLLAPMIKDNGDLYTYETQYYDFIGAKNTIEIFYSDSTKSIRYLTIFEGKYASDNTYYTATVAPYYKSSSTAIEVTFAEDITADNIYNVEIDDKCVEYTVDSNNKVLVSSSIVDLLSVGKHIVYIDTDLGSLSVDVYIHNNAAFTPYNVRVDLDSEPGHVLLCWDYDFVPTEITVVIQSMSYTKSSNPTLFNGNVFDATGKLTTVGQTYYVSVQYGGNTYESAHLSFGYNMSASNISKYTTKDLTVYGKSINRYVTSWEDLYDLLFYVLIHADSLPAYSASSYASYKAIYMCLDFDLDAAEQIDYSFTSYVNSKTTITSYSLDNTAFVLALIKEALYLMPEASSCQMVINKATEGFLPSQTYEVGFYFNCELESSVNRTKENTNNSNYKDCEYYPALYGSGLSDSYVFPIETNNNGTANVISSVELYLALERGYKPVINATKYPELASLYNEMKTVLRGILDKDMNDYQKAYAIYEWLCECVLYDHAALNEVSSITNVYGTNSEEYFDTYGWSCFYMEGVFNNRLAVCNGIAAAYSAMCNMMGIPCHKLTGEAENAQGNKEMHAWNEVYICGSWYLVDATWGSVTITISGYSRKFEVLSNAYFLMSTYEAEVTYKHNAKATVYGKKYAQDSYFKKYSELSYKVGSTEYSLEARSRADFTRLLEYALDGNTITSGQAVAINASKSLVSTDIQLEYNVYYIEQATNTAVLLIKK